MQHAAPSCVAVASSQTPDQQRENHVRGKKRRTEVGLHIYFVSSLVIFGAARTCSSVHPSLNCE